MPTRKRGSRVKWLALASVAVVILVVVIVVAVTVTKQRKRSGKSTGVDATDSRIVTSTQPGYSTEAVTTQHPGYENQTEVVTLISVFTMDRLEIRLNFTVYYSVRPEDLAAVLDTYGPSYTKVVRSVATDVIRAVATTFPVYRFVNDQYSIELAMFEDLRLRLWGTCCRPWCHSLLRGCERDCLRDSNCHPSNRAFYADLLAFRLDAVDVSDFILDRLGEPGP